MCASMKKCNDTKCAKSQRAASVCCKRVACIKQAKPNKLAKVNLKMAINTYYCAYLSL